MEKIQFNNLKSCEYFAITIHTAEQHLRSMTPFYLIVLAKILFQITNLYLTDHITYLFKSKITLHNLIEKRIIKIFFTKNL